MLVTRPLAGLGIPHLSSASPGPYARNASAPPSLGLSFSQKSSRRDLTFSQRVSCSPARGPSSNQAPQAKRHPVFKMVFFDDPTANRGDVNNKPENWSGGVPKCGDWCMLDSIQDVRKCDDYMDPECFCTLGPDPFPSDSPVFNCIYYDCGLTKKPGKSAVRFSPQPPKNPLSQSLEI